MKATRKIVKIGNNFYFNISKDMREFIGINDEDEYVEWEDIIDENNKKCIAFSKTVKNDNNLTTLDQYESD